jgi:hypothetical protein
MGVRHVPLERTGAQKPQVLTFEELSGVLGRMRPCVMHVQLMNNYDQDVSRVVGWRNRGA